MYDNGKPPILMSEQPHPVYFAPQDRKSITCLECGTLQIVKQNLIVAHDAPDGLADCPGSFQRVVFDVTAQQERALSAVRAAGLSPARRPSPDAPAYPRDATRRVADILCVRIRTQRLAPGEHLLPTQEIARLLAVDETTVHRALDSLHDQGLLTTGTDGGYTVAADAAAHLIRAAAPQSAARVPLGTAPAPALRQLAAVRRVVDVLREHIRTGRLVPGRRLAVAETAWRLAASEPVVRRALDLLHDQGLLAASPGGHLFVSAAAPRVLRTAA